MSDRAALLQRFYESFDYAGQLGRDPLQFAHRYDNPADVEAVAFIAASLAFGRVAAIAGAVHPLLAALGPHPAVALRDGHRIAAAADRTYRWLQPAEIAALLRAVGDALKEHDSLEGQWRAVNPEPGPLWEDLGRFLIALRARAEAHHPDPRGRSRSLAFLFPSTRGTAACKRQHLFLRWMVRGPTEGVDRGLWTAVTPDRLIVPADVHTARIGHALGLCRRPVPSRRTADELTASLRAYDAADPVRFDFALCHLGISGACKAARDPVVCPTCDLRSACRWWADKSEAPLPAF